MEGLSRMKCILVGWICLLAFSACSSQTVPNQPIEEKVIETDTPQPRKTEIIIDGAAEDWVDRPLLHEDPPGDGESEYLDITKVYAFVNQNALYILIEVVDPTAPFVQIDVELSADNERKIVNWRPELESWKQFPRSQFVLGTVLEGRIDLKDIGSPEETVVIYQVRAMAGDQPPSEDWRGVDLVSPKLQAITWVNEYDRDQPMTDVEVPLDSSGRRVNYTTSGYIDEDEIWRDEIHITGDIEFVNGATLTIEPGTLVYIASNSDDRQANDTVGCYSEYTCLHDDPTLKEGWGANSISIDGTGGVLNAEGTSEAPILILPEGDSTSSSQYGPIMIERGILKYTKILYSNGVEILRSPSGFEIAHSEIRYCLSNCLTITKDSGWVHHNIIEGGGIAAFRVGSHSIVEHNMFLRSNVGILVEGQEDVILRNNLVLDCSTGIAVNSRDIEVSNNTIAYVDGPPDGIYYQGEMVYPLFDSWIDEFGIGVNGVTRVFNNIIAAPYPIGLFTAEFDPRIVVEYNLVWGPDSWAGGPGSFQFTSTNFVADPLFVDLAEEDFHLSPDSPGIDAGLPDVLDADGTPSDLGAYGGPFSDGW